MASATTPPTGRGAPRVRSDRSPWNWLLLVPIVLPLLVPLYNRMEPELFGWPFFYWFQVAMVPVGVVTTLLVYRATRRPAAQRTASAPARAGADQER
jgi:uncharacterized membrane protein